MGDGCVSLAPVAAKAEPVPHLPPGAVKLSQRDYDLDRLAGPDVGPDFA
jgi:hypothetical protein